MKTKIVKYCDIILDEDEGEIRIVVFGGGNNCVRHDFGSNKIDLKELKKQISRYWDYVDENIESGVVDGGDERALRKFFAKIQTLGSQMASILLTSDMKKSLWRHASESDIFLLWTDAEWIPWESLYYRRKDEGAFLSDNCVIARIPTTTNDDFDDEDGEDEDVTIGRIVCIDPELEREISAEGDSVAERFQEIGEDVYFTELIQDFTSKISDKKVINWICEHDLSKGLRLCSDVFYSTEDCESHRFPKDSVVIMISCCGSRSSGSDPGFSRNIVSNSRCTVVAPSSVIAAKAGIDFVLRLVNLMKRTGSVEVHELWALLKRPFDGSISGQDEVTPEKCYSLWFNIYGNCEVRLEGTTN